MSTAGIGLVPPRAVALAAAGAGALGAGLLALGEHGPVLCPFRLATGGYCPACGMTRAVGHLIRGDVVGSWHMHPFLLLILGQAAVIAAAWGVAELRRSRSGAPNPVLALLRRRADTLQLVNGGLLLALWVIRLATHAIPAPFA
ncbi:MAG: DUF2752 domain-containing protein [Acidimicrobiales bacterium]